MDTYEVEEYLWSESMQEISANEEMCNNQSSTQAQARKYMQTKETMDEESSTEEGIDAKYVTCIEA